MRMVAEEVIRNGQIMAVFLKVESGRFSFGFYMECRRKEKSQRGLTPRVFARAT